MAKGEKTSLDQPEELPEDLVEWLFIGGQINFEFDYTQQTAS